MGASVVWSSEAEDVIRGDLTAAVDAGKLQRGTDFVHFTQGGSRGTAFRSAEYTRYPSVGLVT